MKVLIVGNGQIGQGMQEILSRHHEVHIRDIQAYPLEDVEMLHICYPDSLYFVKDTREYIREYNPKITIIHSSIAPRKTSECGPNVVHVPVRGRHPNLGKNIPAFPLFVGSNNKEAVQSVVAYLEGCNLVATPVFDSVATEMVKLLSNIHMGLEIAWRQEVKRILEQYAIDPLVYERWEDSYNEGYRFTNDEQLIRPRLKPDPIGGHCILECTEILGKQYRSKAFEFIEESNEKEKTKRNGHSRSTSADASTTEA